MATATTLAMDIVQLGVSREGKSTFPIFAVGAVFTTFLTVILDITIPVVLI